MTTDRHIAALLERLRHELNYSEHTVAAYGRDLSQYVDFLGGGVRAADVCSADSTDVRAWLAERSEAGDSARTLRRKLQAVRALYRHLMREGLVADSPAADLELARLPRRLPTFVRESQLDAVLDAAPADGASVDEVRDALVVEMLYHTGMRRAELITLADAAVDTCRGELRVRGKRDKDRVIPFGPELARAIDNYRSVRDAAGRRGDTLFTRRDGLPLYPRLVYNIVHRALTQAGVPGKCSPHVLRHSFATAMLAHGAALDAVKELLGHQSIATTQVYTHVTLSDLKNNYKLAHPRAIKKGG